MIDPSDKKMLYWLIDLYVEGKINGPNFEKEYCKSYCLETDLDTLTAKERKAFISLSEVAGRVSFSSQDLKNYPGVYYTSAELHEKIIETKEALKDCWITVEHS